MWYSLSNKDYIGLGFAAGIAEGQGTVRNSLCSLLCLPAPFKRLVCDLEPQAYGCEVFLDLLSQIGSDYSARPPTVSELMIADPAGGSNRLLYYPQEKVNLPGRNDRKRP